MRNVKFVEPLFDNNYFRDLYLANINPLLENELTNFVNDWIIVNIYNPLQYAHETQSTAILSWKQELYCANQLVYTALICVDEDGNILPNSTSPSGVKTSTVHNFDLLDIADKKNFYNICVNYKFMYLWYSIHKGPSELVKHIDKNSAIRYVQCIYKNGIHNDWWYDGEYLKLNEGDAFIFDPKYAHSIYTDKGCDSVFLIADCPQHTIDEFIHYEDKKEII